MRSPFGVIRYWWVALAGFGFLPALLLSNVLLGWVSAANWSCSEIEFGASGSQYGGCSTIAGELIVAVVVAWIVPLSVSLALLYLFRRSRPEVDTDTTGEGGADWTGIFVRSAAVLVGLINVLAVVDPEIAFPFADDRSPVSYFLSASLSAAVAGLVTSGVVLRLGRGALSGGFSARYGMAVLGMCVGGAILGGLNMVNGAVAQFFVEGFGEASFVASVYPILAYGLFAALAGGVLGALEGLILAFPLAAVLGKLRRPQRNRGVSLAGVAALCLLAVAMIASHAASPPAPPEAASADLRPRPSCPEYMEEEIGVFEGPGNRTTPAFETTGYWGYEYSASGSGTFEVEVLDENGEAMPGGGDPIHDLEGGSSIGGAEFASGGAFRLKIDADDVNYEILVCDGSGPEA